MTTPSEEFILELESTDVGKIILINMWDSVSIGLIDKSFIKEFIDYCVLVRQSNATWSCLSIFRYASLKLDGKNSPVFLRKSHKNPTTKDGKHWSNLVPWTSWFGYHADKQKAALRLGSSIPALSGGITRAQMPAVQVYFDDVTSQSDWWHADTGNLGLPLPKPSNCWISSDAFAKLSNSTANSFDPATESRDALGLIDSKMGTVLVAYNFSPNSAKRATDSDVARPNFADLGNSRFRTHNKEPLAVHYASAGWGSTAHLAKFAQGKRTDTAGRPERVSRTLPISKLQNLSVSLLGYVACSRGDSGKDDDSAFVRHILRRRKMTTIQQRIINICA